MLELFHGRGGVSEKLFTQTSEIKDLLMYICILSTAYR